MRRARHLARRKRWRCTVASSASGRARRSMQLRKQLLRGIADGFMVVTEACKAVSVGAHRRDVNVSTRVALDGNGGGEGT
eukprot:364316-Chlamydomonas_euryale.AAC.8